MEQKKECLTGACPPLEEKEEPRVKLSEGSGGKEMHLLIAQLQTLLHQGKWQNTSDDAASFHFEGKHLLFTTDSYVITPLFFQVEISVKLHFAAQSMILS